MKKIKSYYITFVYTEPFQAHTIKIDKEEYYYQLEVFTHIGYHFVKQDISEFCVYEYYERNGNSIMFSKYFIED